MICWLWLFPFNWGINFEFIISNFGLCYFNERDRVCRTDLTKMNININRKIQMPSLLRILIIFLMFLLLIKLHFKYLNKQVIIFSLNLDILTPNDLFIISKNYIKFIAFNVLSWLSVIQKIFEYKLIFLNLINNTNNLF